MSEEPAQPLKSEVVNGSEASLAVNPFAEVSVTEETAMPSKDTDDIMTFEVVTKRPSVMSPPTVLEVNESKPTVELVQEMVGGLEVSTADMIDKIDIAKTPKRF